MTTSTVKNCETIKPTMLFLPPVTTENSEGVSLPLGNSKDFIISFDLKFTSNGSVSVVLETTEKGAPFIIHYVTSAQLIAFSGRDITYGIGPRAAWSTVTRDLLTDLRKGVGLSNTKAVKATKVSTFNLNCVRAGLSNPQLIQFVNQLIIRIVCRRLGV